MKILLIGQTGQLGSALIKNVTSLGYDMICPSRKEFDIIDKNKLIELISEHNPDMVINTAAFHDVSLCEIEPKNAFKYNSIAIYNMAKICFEHNIKFVTFSTDYVFSGMLSDGRIKTEPYVETDPPQPLQIYGLSKLAGEYGSLIYPTTIVIRTCGLYGEGNDNSKGGRGNFVDNRIRDSKDWNRIQISNDQTVSPTYAEDLSKAVLKLIKHSDSRGIYHLVNEGHCNWFEFTKEIFRINNILREVIPVDRKGKTGEMRRPLFSALKNERARKLGITLPGWKDALRRYLMKDNK